MGWIDEANARVVGKCPFCGFEVVSWDFHDFKMYECTNCELRIIKEKGD